MTEVLVILIMIIIGAIIGGVTNSLAIKMLFRPYEAKYIGNWKLPLTPGLIPKRRDELAKQLGKMVVEHLLTPEGLKKKLTQKDVNLQITEWAQNEVSRFLKQDKSIRTTLENFGIEINENKVREKISNWTEKQYDEMMSMRRSKTVRELLSDNFVSSAEDYIGKVTIYIQNQLGNYVASNEANKKLASVVDSYLEGKGFVGNMIASFIGNDSLADRIQPVLVRYIRSAEGKVMIEALLSKELQQLLDHPVGQLEMKIGAKKISNSLGMVVADNLPIGKWLNHTVNQLVNPFREQIFNLIVPTMVTKIIEVVVERIDIMMEKFKLEEVVEREVESFPIERVEQLVLSISKREFKLITFLGALLGGIIGLVQGIIVILIG